MEYLIGCLLFLLFIRLLLQGSSSRPKALENQHINNPTPLFPTFDKERLGWMGLLLFGVRKPDATTHGSAELMGQRELNKLLRTKKHKGLIVDGTNRLPLDSMHYAIIGGSGSGKTSKFLIPNLLQPNNHSSIVVSDPSKECFKTCAATLVKNGYTVKVLSFEDGQTLCYNPLSRCNSSKDILKVSDIIISSAFESGGQDVFWQDGGSTIIALIIKALKNSPRYCNLANVRYVLNLYNPTDNSLLDHFMVTNLANKIDFFDYQGFMANETKIISSFVSTAKIGLKSMLDDHLARLTSQDTIDFLELRQAKTCLFIQYPENQTAYYSFIIKILYTQLFDMCMRTGMNGKDDKHIMIYLDEFANIGAVPGFSSLITTLRKRKTCVNIFIQALEQVDQVYPRQAESILYGGINTHLYLNSLSQKTCEQLSRRVGNFTIEDAEKGHRHARNLITPSELRLMGNDACLMLYKNRKPAMFRVTPFYENPKLLKLVKKSAGEVELGYPPLPSLEFITPPVPPSKGKGNGGSITFDL